MVQVLVVLAWVMVKVMDTEVAMAHHTDTVDKMTLKNHSSSPMIKFIMMNIEEMF
jgi:hypothetical protein